jgi:cysteine desulfurase/selenocysteine lyase
MWKWATTMTTSKYDSLYPDPREYGLPAPEDLKISEPYGPGLPYDPGVYGSEKTEPSPDSAKLPSVNPLPGPEAIPRPLGIPDYHAPEAYNLSGIDPESLGSFESIPDYHLPEAYLPSDLDPQRRGSQKIPRPGEGPSAKPERAYGIPNGIPGLNGIQGFRASEAEAGGAAERGALESTLESFVPNLSSYLASAEDFLTSPEGDSLVKYLSGEATVSPAISPSLIPAGGETEKAIGVGKIEPLGEGRPIPYVGAYPVDKIRGDFPILSEKVEGGNTLVWFDNAATTQKPKKVMERLLYYYEHENSNVHRGAHTLAARATDAYEEAREKVAGFLGAKSSSNIVFLRGTTEAINLIAQSYVKPRLRPGDEIILTALEHHANIVPWQVVASETGAYIRVAPVDETGQIILSEYQKLFNPRTRFVSVTHVSNALGTVTPVAELIAGAHARGVPIAIDGAQSVSHLPVNVSVLGADFYVFSGHKIYGPTGIGALYGTDEVLADSLPYQTGGNMIADVTFEKTVYQGPPQKFEAGTGNIAGAVGLGAALDYVSKIGLLNIANYEESLLRYATDLVLKIPKLKIIGTAPQKASVISFVIDGVAAEEVGSRLSSAGIAVRAGHHCAQPILRRFGLEGTVRASLAFYNTAEEVDYFVATLREIAR